MLEIVWAIGLKFTAGFSRPAPTAITLVAIAASFWLLSLALRVLPLGAAYAVWVGIGAIGAAIAGVLLFDEPLSTLKLVTLVLVVADIAGLKLASSV